MRTSSTIGVWACIISVTLASGGVANVLVPPYLLSKADGDAWLSVLIALPFVLIWSIGLWYVIRKLNGASLQKWLSTQFNRPVSWLIRLPVILMLLVQATTASWETGHIAVRSYMNQTPLWVIIFATTLLCVWTAYSGLRSIAYSSIVLIPIGSILDVLLVGLNRNHMDYRMLLPVLEHGYQPVINGAFLAAAGLTEIWLLIWLQQEVKGSFKWWQPFLLVLYLTWLELIPVVLSIAVFGPDQATKLRGPILEIWRNTSLGYSIEHIDLFAIVQRTASNFARLSLQFYIMTSLAGFRSPKSRGIFMALLALAVASISSLPISDSTLIAFLFQFQYPVFIVMVPLVTAILAFMLRWRPPAQSSKEAAET
ncbi:GerAB/ArcD/ProY family transporter [Paenibacillus herberti]|nr:GerAB/ArcD/ProY family transporter [Paenibacillus herberti]